MPHYHLSLTTDQPVAIKTRISARSSSKDSNGDSGANSGAETELRNAAVTVDELQAVVQLLEIQMQNLGRNVETVLKLYEDQRTKPDAPCAAQSLWRKLGTFLGWVSRRQVLKTPGQSGSE